MAFQNLFFPKKKVFSVFLFFIILGSLVSDQTELDYFDFSPRVPDAWRDHITFFFGTTDLSPPTALPRILYKADVSRRSKTTHSAPLFVISNLAIRIPNTALLPTYPSSFRSHPECKSWTRALPLTTTKRTRRNSRATPQQGSNSFCSP